MLLLMALNRVILVWHAHQPVLNQHDIEVCYSRFPFILENHPKQKFVMNIQGSLLSQLFADKNWEFRSYDPQEGWDSGVDMDSKTLLDRYKELVTEGRIELLASAFYHPIIPLLLDDGRFGLSHYDEGYRTAKMQIRRNIDLIKRLFNFEPYGIWLPENAFSMFVIPLLKDDYGMSHSLEYCFSEQWGPITAQYTTYDGKNFLVVPRDRTTAMNYMNNGDSDPIVRADNLYSQMKTVVDGMRNLGYSDDAWALVLTSDAEFIGIHWQPAETMINRLLWAFDNDDDPSDGYDFEAVTFKEFYDYKGGTTSFEYSSSIPDSSWGPNQYIGPYYTPFDEWNNNYFDRFLRDRQDEARKDVLATLDALGYSGETEIPDPRTEVMVKLMLNSEQSDWRYYYNEGGSPERGYNYHLAIAAEKLAEDIRNESPFRVYEKASVAYGPSTTPGETGLVIMETPDIKVYLSPLHDGKIVGLDSKNSFHDLVQTWYTEKGKLFNALTVGLMKTGWSYPWEIERAFGRNITQTASYIEVEMNYTCDSSFNEFEGLKVVKKVRINKDEPSVVHVEIIWENTNSTSNITFFPYVQFAFTPGGHVDDYMKVRYFYKFSTEQYYRFDQWSTAWDTSTDSCANIKLIDLRNEIDEKLEVLGVANQEYSTKFVNAEMWYWWNEIGFQEPSDWVVIKPVYGSGYLPVDYFVKGQKYQSWTMEFYYPEGTLQPGQKWITAFDIYIGTGIYPPIDPDRSVMWEPENPVAGDTVTIKYSPIVKELAEAEQIYIHMGHDGWMETSDIPMKKAGDHWEVQIETQRGWEVLNFVFRDDNNHWDNNEGRNWEVPLASSISEISFESHLRNSPVKPKSNIELKLQTDKGVITEYAVYLFDIWGNPVKKYADESSSSELVITFPAPPQEGIYFYKVKARIMIRSQSGESQNIVKTVKGKVIIKE